VNNAITREATALVCVPEADSTAFLDAVGAFEGAVQAELADADPGVTVEATAADLPPQVMHEEAQATLLDALGATPQGVIAMSEAVPGLVETSTNIGVVKIGDGQTLVQSFMRSSVDTGLDDVGQQIASVWAPSGADVQFVGRFSGWNPDPDSPVLGLMKASYLDLFGSDAEVLAVHAGLECGEIGAKYPGIDMISIGPTLIDVHTPDERLQIASVRMVNDLLFETLKRIAQE
jgi:dipeptidase D